MKYITRLMVFLSLIFSSAAAYSKPTSIIKKALGASVQVIIPQRSLGSGVAVWKKNGLTLVITNDHVCQGTRGNALLSEEPNYKKPLNTLPILVEDTFGRKWKAKVVKTANLHLKRNKGKSDLCLLATRAKIGVVKFDKDMELGSKVFSIGGPKGLFPLIHEGYAGALYGAKKEEPSRTVTLMVNKGSSGGGVFMCDTGKLTGIVYAIEVVDHYTIVPIAAWVIPGRYAKEFLEGYLAQ